MVGETSRSGIYIVRKSMPSAQRWPFRCCLNLAEQPYNLSPSLRVHRQQVDDVGPPLPVLVSVAHQLRGDRVAVGSSRIRTRRSSSRALGSRVERRARR
jgi:hypothetical protein